MPANTKRANISSLKALARFTTSRPGFLDAAFKGEEHLRDHILMGESRSEWEILETRKAVFPDCNYSHIPAHHTAWTTQQLKTVRFHLIEFAVNYRSKSGEEVKPITMRGYILGLQRAFKYEWGYDLKLLEGDVFNCPAEGLMAVLDNKFSLQQSTGVVAESHNVLSKEDVIKLYESPLLDRDTPLGFQARLVFSVALITAMRPSALVHLTVGQVQKITCGGEQVWKICGVIGSRVGASKTATGGWKAVQDKPQEVCVWNRTCLGGKLNLFEDLEDYMRIRNSLDCGSDRFFLAANARATTFENFFKRQHLGRNAFARIVGSICRKEGITGTGVKQGMTLHGLRGSVVTLLFEDGQNDVNVAMRTGHRDLSSLKNYHNLRGALGMQQQAAIFGDSNAKRQKVEVGCEEQAAQDGQENLAAGDEVEECFQEGGTEKEDSNMRLLSGVQNISGGVFTINVNNHYR